jgi:tetratricopeptide (TPR) repeat protein
MIGVAYFTDTSLKIEQIFLEKPECEAEFLCYFDELLKDFDTFATYNGKAFDIPMLRSRFILARLPVSFNQYAHLDLLHMARRIWKLRLESRRLAEIEKEILALSRNEEEIPGWLVPQIYFDYLESRDAAPLKGVFYHNEMDVASLAALFIHINQLLENGTTQKGADGRDAYSIGSAFVKMGKWDLSRDFLKTGMQQGLPDDLQKEAARGFAHTLKKQGQWEEAIQYWEFAAQLGDYAACIELAKYFEHRQNDCQNALKWVEIASEMSGDPNYDQSSLDLRRKRLDTKQKKSERNHER